MSIYQYVLIAAGVICAVAVVGLCIAFVGKSEVDKRLSAADDEIRNRARLG